MKIFKSQDNQSVADIICTIYGSLDFAGQFLTNNPTLNLINYIAPNTTIFYENNITINSIYATNNGVYAVPPIVPLPIPTIDIYVQNISGNNDFMTLGTYYTSYTPYHFTASTMMHLYSGTSSDPTFYLNYSLGNANLDFHSSTFSVLYSINGGGYITLTPPTTITYSTLTVSSSFATGGQTNVMKIILQS